MFAFDYKINQKAAFILSKKEYLISIVITKYNII
jgi:hypothetical protein